MSGAERKVKRSRDRILEAAMREFGEHGFAGARTERIARAAVVNKQLLFYYFKSKAGLYQAVLEQTERGLAQASARVREADHAADRLRRQLEQAFRSLAANPDGWRLVLDGALRREAATPVGGGAVRALIDRVRSVISEGQGLGFFRDDADPDRLAHQTVVLLVGYLAVEPALEHDGPAEGRRTDWIAGVCDLVLDTLTW